MATPVSDIVGFLDALLDAAAFEDYGPNGLQVPGPETVEVVATGVSAHRELIEAAAAEGAGLLLVHHGLFWRGQPLQITPLMDARLRPLYRSEMALAAYHLPLDAHPAHGNNALLAEAIGAHDPAPFAAHHGRPIGIRAAFAPPGLTPGELGDRVRAATGGRDPLVIDGAGERIRSIGIVSGGGTDYLADAIDAGLDAFLTGEPSERAFGMARDAGITFVAGGHHATETFGVTRLGELLAQQFGVRHVPIDVPNPI